MASPPSFSHPFATSTSPPYPSHTPLPSSKKRPADLLGPGPNNKRRKPSMVSNTSAHSAHSAHPAHPLRQTSFPPEGPSPESGRYSPSASIDGASLVSGATGTVKIKKKRGRKSKADTEAASVAGGRAGTVASGANGKDGRDETPLDEEDDGDDGVVATTRQNDEEQRKEAEWRSMLYRHFDSDQQTRFETWRSTKFQESVTRRLVNQTLSQSAPATVINAIRWVAKSFAGDLIEKAREVQTQWLERGVDEFPVIAPPPQSSESPNADAEKVEDKMKETRRGPLTPDHLREALRRIKIEKGTGGEAVGLLNLHKMQQRTGVERFGIRLGGRQLFR